MNEKNDRQLRLMRLQTFFLAAIFVLVLIAVIFVVRGMSDLHNGLTAIEQSLETIDFEQLESTADSFAQAAKNFGELDVDAFNGFVGNLEEITKQLQAATKGFGNLFSH